MIQQGYVIGKWATSQVFVAEDLQPTEKITTLKAMMEWASKHYADIPGEYALINNHNGTMLIGKQMELSL